MAKKKTTATQYSYEPDFGVAPGQTLQETIDALGIDQRELAARSGISAKHINQIIKGVAPISHDTAIRLERVTGVPARMWNNLESNYREQLARLEEREWLQRHQEWLNTIPVKELVNRCVIEANTSKAELMEAVLAFFGVASVEAWQEGWSAPQFAFRKSLAFEGKVGAMATWLRLGEVEAQEVKCEPFDKARFRIAIDEIRNLTVHRPDVFVPQILSLCAASGVAVAFVPEIKGAPVSGAAKWLTPSKAMICLNLRGKRNDRFWFTFFHEAGHILHDSKKETYIDVDYQNDPREQQANRFARTILIPPQYDKDLPTLTSYATVESFARRINIDPGIVVGRLQREGIISFRQLNGLKQQLQWVESN